MSKPKYIDIIINKDGTVDFDQAGYEGKECHGDIDDLIELIGPEKETTKKKEYNKNQKVHIKQKKSV